MIQNLILKKSYLDINVAKAIHIELTKEQILCQKIKSSDYRAATLARACNTGNKPGSSPAKEMSNINFNQHSSYFWVNPNVDIESKLYEFQSQINVATVKKKSHLKSKQTYLSSQSKKLEEKMPGMQTLAQGQKDLDKICEEIDQICKDKIIHEQANQQFFD